MARKSRSKKTRSSSTAMAKACNVAEDQKENNMTITEPDMETHLFSDQDDPNVDLVQAQAEHLDQVVSQIGPKSRSVIYVGHIPFGFFEQELHGYFSQFGDIVRLRLSRNSKTLKSRHFAFIEFDNAHVAEIAAKAMNGYMMFGRTLVCHVVDDNQLHKATLRRYWKVGQSYENRRPEKDHESRDVKRTVQSHELRIKKIGEKQQRKCQKLKDLGIKFQPILLNSPAAV